VVVLVGGLIAPLGDRVAAAVDMTFPGRPHCSRHRRKRTGGRGYPIGADQDGGKDGPGDSLFVMATVCQDEF